jgi:hypothetical protein
MLGAAKVLAVAAFSAGVTWAGLSGRISSLEDGKADAQQVAVLIEREALHHAEVMRAIGKVEAKIDGLQVQKADKP